MKDNPQHERFMRLFLESEPELLRTALIYVPTRNDAREIIQETAIALWRDFDNSNIRNEPRQKNESTA